MKEFFSIPANVRRIEFWAATTIFVFAVFFLITSGIGSGNDDLYRAKYQFSQNNIRFHYYEHYFLPTLTRYVVVYLGFLALNFLMVPKLIAKQNIPLQVMLAIAIYFVVSMVFGTADTYTKAYVLNKFSSRQAAYNELFQHSFLLTAWLFLLLTFYTLIRHIGIYILSHSENIQGRYQMITPGGLIAFVLWMLSTFLLLINQVERIVITGWVVIIPLAIGLYWYSFHTLIPAAYRRPKPFRSYIGKMFLLQLILLLPIGILSLLLSGDMELASIITMFNGAIQLFIMAPFNWIAYRQHVEGKKEVTSLKQQLGTSHASFDFLRSQINPHFLFNALNTIYGTAIQEDANRTSEAVEKLGNMMRFMLQENMQEKISLAREIDYLNNYIDLQKLRTDANPAIRINTEIQQQVNTAQIAPMLLIPFVENAFKHGISLREDSQIRVTLELKEKILYFDVFNSKHPKSDNDPEKEYTGVGLSNVKQRLQLFYPGRHELIIRETAKDFFVHLTIKLS